MADSEVDRVIRSLIETNGPVSDNEIARIVNHIAQAEFSSRTVKLSLRLKGQELFGQKLGTRASSDMAHLAKRVLLEKQWGQETRFDEYLTDLRNAIRHEKARLVVYRSRGTDYAAFLSPNTIPERRLGQTAKPWIWTIYDADYGIIITGYQVSGIETVRLPGDALWLR